MYSVQLNAVSKLQVMFMDTLVVSLECRSFWKMNRPNFCGISLNCFAIFSVSALSAGNISSDSTHLNVTLTNGDCFSCHYRNASNKLTVINFRAIQTRPVTQQQRKRRTHTYTVVIYTDSYVSRLRFNLFKN